MKAKRKSRGIVPDRAKVLLSDRQEEVLCDLLSGYDIAQIAEVRGLTKSNVSHIKSRLKKTFNAKSTVHLMILAILERKYYQIITENSKDHRTDSISEKEVEILRYVLDGWLSKEIAEPTNLNVRTIEFHRYEFNKKCNVSNNKDFINACLQNGILKIIPFEFQISKTSIDGLVIDEISMAFENFHIDRSTKTINEHGFIYFDFQNRFRTFDSFASSLYNVFKVNPFVFSLILSGIPFPMISHISELSEPYLMARQRTIEDKIKEQGGYLKFYKLLEELNFYKPVITNVKMPRISRLSILLFVEGIEKCLSNKEKCEVTKLDIETIIRQEQILHKEFNCETRVALIAQTIHLGICRHQ
ncbi:MAG: hypothetical protein Crog4KO_25830 [Crocinitomicaceae bacterium]